MTQQSDTKEAAMAASLVKLLNDIQGEYTYVHAPVPILNKDLEVTGERPNPSVLRAQHKSYRDKIDFVEINVRCLTRKGGHTSTHFIVLPPFFLGLRRGVERKKVIGRGEPTPEKAREIHEIVREFTNQLGKMRAEERAEAAKVKENIVSLKTVLKERFPDSAPSCCDGMLDATVVAVSIKDGPQFVIEADGVTVEPPNNLTWRLKDLRHAVEIIEIFERLGSLLEKRVEKS